MKRRYVKIPNDIMTYKLKPVAFRVIVTLYSEFFMTDEFVIKHDTIAQKCGISVSSVKRAINELVKAELIEKQSRYDFFSRKRLCSKYKLKRLSGNYFTIDRGVLDITEDNYQLMVYCAIKSCANKSERAFPSISKLENITGFSEATIIKHTNVLMKCGLLYKCNYISQAGDYGNNNYTVWNMNVRVIIMWILSRFVNVRNEGYIYLSFVFDIIVSFENFLISRNCIVYLVQILDDS